MTALLLDTAVLIDVERGRVDLADLIEDDDDTAIAAVTVAELLEGLEHADDRRRASRQAAIDVVLDSLPVLPYDLDTARAHAALLAVVRRSGRRRGAHDLIIAATALATGRTVVTTDVRGFDELPGVEIRHPG